MKGELQRLTRTFACDGAVRWIGQRPARRAVVEAVSQARIELDGVVGDHRATPGKRALTLIQWEHLPVIAALAGMDDLDPALLRRNVAVSGINLLGLRKERFRVGSATLLGTGLCAPCSRMEEVLGRGGYTAMRGHGGITAEVIDPGNIELGDAVQPLIPTSDETG